MNGRYVDYPRGVEVFAGELGSGRATALQLAGQAAKGKVVWLGALLIWVLGNTEGDLSRIGFWSLCAIVYYMALMFHTHEAVKQFARASGWQENRAAGHAYLLAFLPGVNLVTCIAIFLKVVFTFRSWGVTKKFEVPELMQVVEWYERLPKGGDGKAIFEHQTSRP